MSTSSRTNGGQWCYRRKCSYDGVLGSVRSKVKIGGLDICCADVCTGLFQIPDTIINAGIAATSVSLHPIGFAAVDY